MIGQGLETIEYLVCFSVLAGSAIIGLYYGCCKKSETVDEYMLGGKKMPVLPISLSLIASFVSGVTLVGFPSEMYMYGTQLYAYNFAIIAAAIIFYFVFLPVTYKMKCNSVFEYLENRFDTRVRKLASGLFAMTMVMYLPIIIYVPALTFNEVSGVPLHILGPSICFICIFYTTIGGLKAVVWSDALQSFFTMTSICIVMVLGIQYVGGMGHILEVAEKGNRLELFNMDMNPLTRNTLPTIMGGSIINWLYVFSFNPGTYQRFKSLKSYSDAKLIVYIMCIGLFTIKSISALIGLVIYTKYHDCDPIITKKLSKPGQLLPFHVQDIAGHIPGVTGLFLSGIISTALSTMSTGLNTLSGTIFEDFIKPFLPKTTSDRTSNLIMKSTVVIIGGIATGMVFIVDKLGSIMQTSISVQGIANGAIFYIFTMGFFVPWANSKGLLIGGLASILTSSWIAVGAQIARAEGRLSYPPKWTSVSGCPENFTLPEGITSNMTFGYYGYGPKVVAADDLPWVYQISYLYYNVIGLSAGLIVGIAASFLTKAQDLETLDPSLILPMMRWVLPKKAPNREETNPALYKLVPMDEINQTVDHQK